MSSKSRLRTYALLELNDLLVCQRVRLGDHRDQVDFGVEAAHEFDVNLLQPSNRDSDIVREALRVNRNTRTSGPKVG